MKKIILLVLMLACSGAISFAESMDGSVTYTHAPDLDRAEATAMFAVNLNTLVGLDFSLSNERQRNFDGKSRDFKDPIYSIGLPISLDFDFLQVNLRPFYYIKNNEKYAINGGANGYANEASAFGIKSKFIMNLQSDELDDIYTKAFIDIAFARQKGTLLSGKDDYNNQYFSQMAYTLGFSQSYYRTFGFEVAGNLFQYPSGIEGVSKFRGIMNQEDLADTQTLQVVHDLAKYAVHAKISRMWSENKSSLYVAYRYGEYYTNEPEHSIIVGNSFQVEWNVFADVAYNHVLNVHNENRSDVFSCRLIFVL